MHFLGIDLGTSAVKMLLLDEHQQIVHQLSRSYPIDYPAPGHAEQNPEDWWAAVEDGLREMGRAVHGDITAIALSGQMHGLVCLDDQDQVIRPAILWNDTRAQAEADWLNAEIGVETLIEETGNIAFAGFSAPKILWLKTHEPDAFSRSQHMLLPKDYINFRLTGRFSTDCSDASGTLLFDVKNRRWSKRMLGICGIEAERLGTLHESWMPVGTLRPEVAEGCGVCPDCVVAAGASDNAAAAVGTGVVGDDACMVSLGTSGTVMLTGRYRTIEAPYGIHAFAHADGRYHLLGCMLTAAACVGWWSKQVIQATFPDLKPAETMPADPDLFFLPYLMGERSPHNDSAIRGAFIGLDMEHNQADLSLAILEGIAFGLRDALEQVRQQGVKFNRLRLCGGGAKNVLWQQILAAVFRCEIELVQAEEGASLGAALLAAVCGGRFATVDEAVAATVQVKQSILPQPDWVAGYEHKYRRFTALYPALRALR